MTLRGRNNYYPCLDDGEAEAQRGEELCQRYMTSGGEAKI